MPQVRIAMFSHVTYVTNHADVFGRIQSITYMNLNTELVHRLNRLSL